MLDDLNDKQREAVLIDINTPALIIAGAGSGKTKTLTYKIAYIIREYNLAPYSIFSVTFTNKASVEIKERINTLLSDKIFFPYMGTFHSVFLYILRTEGYKYGIPKYFSIFDDDDQKKIVASILKDLNLNSSITPRSILPGISKAKNNFIKPKDYIPSNFYEENVEKVYKIYQQRLEDSNGFDFDDILFKSLEIISENEELRVYLEDKFKYILVDEYQDTNTIQYNLLRLISGNNVFFVGDPDQNIYSWRGTDIRNILNFETDYPTGQIIKLEQNYRSTKFILKASESVISRNTLRYEKKLWTDNDLGNLIKVYQASDEEDEARYIASKITDNGEYNDTAVLYRTNAQSRAIEDSFLRYKIPYKVYGGMKFYQRKEIKDIIAYLRFIQNKEDILSLKRIINVPARKIGKGTIDKLDKKASELHISLGSLIIDNPVNLPLPVSNFSNLIREIILKKDSLGVNEFLKYLVKKIKYFTFLELEGEEGLSRMENIEEFIGVSGKYNSLEEFLFDISLVQKEELDTSSVGEYVTLMSLHSAKGLEFKNIFIAGLEENIFPHSRSLGDISELEEERRLCYVGMTRAKEKLFLTFAQKRSLYGYPQANPPSRFLSDISEECIDFDYI
jgi:DNA helicase-2/ATP-dependent DNA helicase PcrA